VLIVVFVQPHLRAFDSNGFGAPFFIEFEGRFVFVQVFVGNLPKIEFIVEQKFFFVVFKRGKRSISQIINNVQKRRSVSVNENSSVVQLKATVARTTIKGLNEFGQRTFREFH
jgi:hypothetical protein